MSDDGFLSRWSRRKAEVKAGRPAPAEPAREPPPAGDAGTGTTTAATATKPATTGPGAMAAEAAASNTASRAPVDLRSTGGSAASAPGATPAAGALPSTADQAGNRDHWSEAPSPLLVGRAPPHPGADAPHQEAAPPPAPTLHDVAALAPGDEISRFVARGVDEGVKRAALKKLFSDPHYNIMDGLDVYIDDYGQPDPIPMAMLRRMNQSKFLGLFAEEEAAEAAAAAQSAAAAPVADGPAPAAAATPPDGEPAAPAVPTADAAPEPPNAALPRAPDEDADLQLQPDDAARRPGAEGGPGRGRG